MPSPPKPNAYYKNNKAILKAVKTVAEKSMKDARDEIHALKGSNEAGILQCGVSCDGAWQRKGHSSMNGCVTTLSIDTGKCLDVDEDSKGFSEVQDVYSKENVEVVKKECVGHVQKRVGSALRKLKKENKGLGRKGKLTDALIDRLQNYYGIAMDDSPFGQTFEFEIFISTAEKSILNLINCKVWLQIIVKCGKYSLVKFANFVYFCITRAKV